MADICYIPKELKDSGLPPVFDKRDIMYFKYVKDGKIIRVARADPERGVCAALYPTENPDEFSGEAFCRIEDKSPRRILKKEEISDKVWSSLLGNIPIPEILKGHKHQMLGTYPSGSYYFERENGRTFHIIEADEPERKAA